MAAKAVFQGAEIEEGGPLILEDPTTARAFTTQARQRNLNQKPRNMVGEKGVEVKVGTPPPVIEASKESFLRIGGQILLPFIISGLAMVGAGLYLDHVQTWEVFLAVPEIIILVPALLGLKGNLEMTLASRLSTEANLGKMTDKKETWAMIAGNLALVQCQATVVGLLSSVVAVCLVGLLRQEFNGANTLLLCATSIVTASIASFFLGILTSGIIVLSISVNINPDNIATPIAASMGDITSMFLLAHTASFLYLFIGTHKWVPIAVIVGYLLIMPLWIWIAKNNKYTQNVLSTGWSPIIIAMLISTLGGLGLDRTVKNYVGLGAFQPVVNGVGGNLVSIQASRLSTALHKQTVLGQLPPGFPVVLPPWKIFTSDTSYAQTSRVLISLVVPGHLVFVIVIVYFQTSGVTVDLLFLSIYMCALLLQVGILLYLGYILTHFFWLRGVNPDNTTIPYLTALGDLLGIILLGLTFYMYEMAREKHR